MATSSSRRRRIVWLGWLVKPVCLIHWKIPIHSSWAWIVLANWMLNKIFTNPGKCKKNGRSVKIPVLINSANIIIIRHHSRVLKQLFLKAHSHSQATFLHHHPFFHSFIHPWMEARAFPCPAVCRIGWKSPRFCLALVKSSNLEVPWNNPDRTILSLKLLPTLFTLQAIRIR